MTGTDISGLKKNYFMRFQLGLICALGFAIMAFNFTTYPGPEKTIELHMIEVDEDIPVVRTATEKPKELPPPEIKISDVIEPIEDIDFIEEKPVEVETKIEIPADAIPVYVAPKPKIAKRIKRPVALAPEPIEPEVDEIKIFVDEMPRFMGCEDLDIGKDERQKCANNELIKYVTSKINYPAIARENGIKGTVIIQFVVEKDGSISNAEIARDIGGGCGAEALRVVNGLPTWVPGRQRSKEVRVRFTLPVKFNFL